MPIEIRELVVRARVDPGSGQRAPSGGRGGSGPAREQRVVEACVREVLRIVEEKRER